MYYCRLDYNVAAHPGKTSSSRKLVSYLDPFSSTMSSFTSILPSIELSMQTLFYHYIQSHFCNSKFKIACDFGRIAIKLNFCLPLYFFIRVSLQRHCSITAPYWSLSVFPISLFLLSTTSCHLKHAIKVVPLTIKTGTSSALGRVIALAVAAK